MLVVFSPIFLYNLLAPLKIDLIKRDLKLTEVDIKSR